MGIKTSSVKAEPENLVCLVGVGRNRFEAEAISNEWRSAIEMWDAWYDSNQEGPMPITIIHEKWRVAPWWKRVLWILRSQWKWSRLHQGLYRAWYNLKRKRDG